MRNSFVISCALAAIIAGTIAHTPTFASSTDTDWTYPERMILISSTRPPHVVPPPYDPSHDEKSITMPAHKVLALLKERNNLVNIVLVDAFSKFVRDSKSDRVHELGDFRVTFKPEDHDSLWYKMLYSLQSTAKALEMIIQLKNCTPLKSAASLSCGFEVTPNWLEHPWDLKTTNSDTEQASAKHATPETSEGLIKNVTATLESLKEKIELLAKAQELLKTLKSLDQNETQQTTQNETQLSTVETLQAPINDNPILSFDHQNGRTRKVSRARGPEEAPVIKHFIEKCVPTPQPSLRVRAERVHFVADDCTRSINPGIIVCGPQREQ